MTIDPIQSQINPIINLRSNDNLSKTDSSINKQLKFPGILTPLFWNRVLRNLFSNLNLQQRNINLLSTSLTAFTPIQIIALVVWSLAKVIGLILSSINTQGTKNSEINSEDFEFLEFKRDFSHTHFSHSNQIPWEPSFSFGRSESSFSIEDIEPSSPLPLTLTINFPDNEELLHAESTEVLIISNYSDKHLPFEAFQGHSVSITNSPNLQSLPSLDYCQKITIKNCPQIRNQFIYLPKVESKIHSTNLLEQGNIVLAGSKIYIEPSTITKNPTLFLNAISKLNVRSDIEVVLFGSGANDEGGVLNQVLSSIMKNLLIDTTLFEMKENYYNPRNTNDKELLDQDIYINIGKLLALAWENRSNIGSHFNPNFFQLLKKFNKSPKLPSLMDSFELMHYLKLLKPSYVFHSDLILNLDKSTPLEELDIATAHTLFTEYVAELKATEKASEIDAEIQSFSLSSYDADRTKIIGWFKDNKNKLIEITSKVMDHEIDSLDPAIYQNLIGSLSICYGFCRNIYKESLEKLKPVELQNLIEGQTITLDSILARLPLDYSMDQFSAPEINAYINLKEWLSQQSPIRLQAFVGAVTGCPNLTSESFHLDFQTQEDRLPTAQTCFNTLFIPTHTLIDEEKEPMGEALFFMKMTQFIDQYMADSDFFGLA